MAKQKIPEQMTAVVLNSYSGAEGLRVEERPVPRPGRNEVLVQIAASPINPSDLVFLEGTYALRYDLPIVPGFEGSGMVVASGGGLMGRYLLGKRVACYGPVGGDGVWAEYLVTGTRNALPLDDAVTLEQGAMSLVNPLTAMAFVTLARGGGHRAFVNTAAAGELGQMLLRLCRREGIEVVNVVRREEHAALLRSQGAAHVLNSSEADFDERLADACRKLDVHLAFDAVAGSMTSRLLQAMASPAKVIVYGRLADEAAQAHPNQLIFEEKSVEGFWLPAWMAQKHLLQSLLLWRRVQKLMRSDLKSRVRARYPLRQVIQAVKEYQGKMTGGKVLLVPEL